MAYNLDKILCITLLCLLLYSRGEMKLKFNQSLQEVTEKYLVDDAINNLIKLECRTNKLASFTWQDCYYHSENIYDPLIYASCEELYAANTCRNIPERNNLFIDPSPTESSLKSSLRHYVMVPKTGGCIGCFASSGNETIRSFTKYYFKDCCGAPDQRDATFWDADCGTRDIPCGLSEKQFQLKCKIGEPEEVSVIEELNEEGKLDLILRWKDSSRNGHYRPFGYEIEVDEAYDHSCRRLTTKYSNFTASTSAPGYHEYKLLGKPSLKIYFNHKYEIKIRTLPFSEWVKINITTRSGRELCDEYYKKTGKRPSRCFMIDNVMVSNCTTDKSVTVSWTINQTFPDDVINVTYLENSRKNSIYWEFDKTNTSITFENVTKPFTIWMFMRKKNLEMLNIQEFQQISCQEPTLTPTKLSTTMKKTVLDTAVIYAVVIGSILFSLVLLSIIIYFGLRKVRTDLVGFNRLLSKEGNEVTMEIGSTSDDKRALIVYPQGCYEVEKLVLFLVKQLNCIGIYPLTDLTQGQRVGEEGETVVMINDFEKATYIIILCTDGLYEFENHKMYNFIMKDLVTADCVHKNSSRYAALYFKKSHRVVPPHLLGRSYAMPNDFRRLLMYFLGVGTFARIYEMLLDTVIGQIDSRYSELKGLVEQLNHSFHKQCDISQCRKGRANMLTEPNVLIKNGKKTREDTPSHDSGIHQMGSMLFGSQESINSKPRGSIDDDEEGIDSERDKLFKEEEL